MMKLKKIFTILVIVGLFFSMSEAFGQISFGEPSKQIIKVTIDEDGIAHVTHEVQGNREAAQQVETIVGTMSNLSVADKNASEVQYLTLEKYPIAIVLPPSNYETIFIKYDLSNVLVLKDGVWTWNWVGIEPTNFYFPENVDMIWINDNPIYTGGKGIRQHGGEMTLEYILNEPIIFKEVTWEDKKFQVGIRTLADIDGFEFNQKEKRITFDMTKDNSLVTAIIPLELLWEPYDVYFNGNQTRNAEFNNNGTHAWVGFSPDTSGTIDIIGTTVIPEFPLFLPLVIGIFMVLMLSFKNKFSFR